MYTLTTPTASDIPLCLSFIDDARAHQREQGFVQWADNYPNADTVGEDIALGRAFMIALDGIPFGYLCIDFAGEPVYNDIDGEWKYDGSCAAVHRVAFGSSARGKGASRELFRLVRELCRERGVNAIRIDTHERNKKMQHVLEREGFVHCGTVYYSGSPRMAYEAIFQADR